MKAKELLWHTDTINNHDGILVPLMYSNLTIRDHIAIEMLKALSPRNMVIEDEKLSILTTEAYRYADALIEKSNENVPFIDKD
jgi:hypothetical protein